MAPVHIHIYSHLILQNTKLCAKFCGNVIYISLIHKLNAYVTTAIFGENIN
jgi:hypothetical protein